MIMEELEDVDKAIEFAKEQDDAELWEDLISYSIDKPRKMSPLLRSNVNFNHPLTISTYHLISPLAVSLIFSFHHRPPQ